MAGALSHIRVLDLSRILAGPWAGQILADLGADVIKVERPGPGDDTRGWGPPWIKDDQGQDTSVAAYYLCANRNKRSITVDITQPEGQDIVRRLAAKSDVVLENFKLGGLKQYGLDYDSLKAVNPRLVYCSITGFGQDGPYAPRAGYDFLIQGLGGLMSITGRPDGEPGAGPMKVGVALTDILTGLYATNAVLAALAWREQSGEGQYIDMALLDVQVACLANQAMNYLATGNSPRRMGNAHPSIVPYQDFPTADGHMILAIGNDGQFARFCEVAGRPELAAGVGVAPHRGRGRTLGHAHYCAHHRGHRDYRTGLRGGGPAGEDGRCGDGISLPRQRWGAETWAWNGDSDAPSFEHHRRNRHVRHAVGRRAHHRIWVGPAWLAHSA